MLTYTNKQTAELIALTNDFAGVIVPAQQHGVPFETLLKWLKDKKDAAKEITDFAAALEAAAQKRKEEDAARRKAEALLPIKVRPGHDIGSVIGSGPKRGETRERGTLASLIIDAGGVQNAEWCIPLQVVNVLANPLLAIQACRTLESGELDGAGTDRDGDYSVARHLDALEAVYNALQEDQNAVLQETRAAVLAEKEEAKAAAKARRKKKS